MNRKTPQEQIEMVADMIAHMSEIPAPTLGLALDGVLDEAPIFFGLLTSVWPGKVIIITFRDDRAKAEADLARLGIRYDELVQVTSFGQKAEVIADRGVMVFIDDQPEALKYAPPTVTVLLMRNGGNFDEKDLLWTFSQQTGKLI